MFGIDYQSLTNHHQDESRNHTSWLTTQTSLLSNHTSLLSAIQESERSYEKQLTGLLVGMRNQTKEIASLKKATSQLDAKQVITI